MNRQQRRAGRIKGPKGERLYPTLLVVQERDANGRPTTLRWAHDDETVGSVTGNGDHCEMLLVWAGETQGFRD